MSESVSGVDGHTQDCHDARLVHHAATGGDMDCTCRPVVAPPPNPYRQAREVEQDALARMMSPGIREVAWDEGWAAGFAAAQAALAGVSAEAPKGERITHGRHCICSACAAEDWTNPQLAPCGMHGSSCPPVYAPLGGAGDWVSAEAAPDDGGQS